MCPPGCHHNGFVVTHALRHKNCSTSYVKDVILVEHSLLVYWYQQCVTIHHVPKCMCCHKAILVKTGRLHYFHDCIYVHLCFYLKKTSTEINATTDEGNGRNET